MSDTSYSDEEFDKLDRKLERVPKVSASRGKRKRQAPNPLKDIYETENADIPVEKKEKKSNVIDKWPPVEVTGFKHFSWIVL